MKLVELAKKWKENNLTTEKFEKEVANIKLFVQQRLENEADDKLLISNNGDSWDEVQDEVFGLGNEDFYKFQRQFKKIKEKVTLKNFIIHLFDFEIDTTELELFNKVGDENFQISIAKEEGTLFMSLAHLKDDESKVKVFEIYKDEAHYEKHRASEQFKHYITTVGHVILKREVLDLKAEFLVENAFDSADYKEGISIEISKLKVADDFREKLHKEDKLKEKIERDKNILAYYILSDKNSEFWYIYKVAKENAGQIIYEGILESEVSYLESDNVVSKGRLN